MRILALETSTELGSCALWQDGQVTERRCPSGQAHSETLLPLVRSLLADAGISMHALDAIAFGVGPGAFTGLRVACGAAQGLAAAVDLPLVPISSLEAMAAQCAGKAMLSVLDARMGEVYSAFYHCPAGHPLLQGEIRVSSPEAIELPAGNDWLACGNALKAYPDLGRRVREHGVDLYPECLPTAATVATLGAMRFSQGIYIDAADALPLYIRDKVAKTVAERLREGGKA